MDTLKQFLQDLGRDAKLAAEYESNPDDVMKRRGLSAQAREAIKRKDVDSVRRLSGLSKVHLTNSTIKSHD